MDYLNILKKIYTPEIGSIWKAPNKIWSTNFAKNKKLEDIHPSILERVRSDGVSVQLAPGTSKEYSIGSCIFKVKIGQTEKTTYFILNLSIPFIIDDLLNLDRCWNGIETLPKKDLDNLDWQIKICKG